MTTKARPMMAHAAGVDWDALARYLAHEDGDAERGRVAAWLAAHPADAALLATLDTAVTRAVAHTDAPGAVTLEIDVEAALARTAARRHATPAVRRLQATTPPRAARRAWPGASGWRWGGLAAAAALGALAVGLGERVAGRVRGASGTQAHTVATVVGVRDSVRLPDGTEVILAPASRLTVAARYGERARAVTLDGEAWFRVRHDDARPFTVHAAGAVVRDIGTAFTVRTDGVAGAGRVAVFVTEGAVELRASATADQPGVLLKAGDRGLVARDGRLDATRGVVSADALAWTRGRLVYRDTPLAEVQADLRRWYGVVLVAGDSAVARRTLTAAFHNDPRARVVDVIRLALGARVVQRGDTAVLHAATRGASAGGAR